MELKQIVAKNLVELRKNAKLTQLDLAEKLNFPGLRYDNAKLCKNKYEIRRKMQENKLISVPQFFEIKNHYCQKSSAMQYNIKSHVAFCIESEPISQHQQMPGGADRQKLCDSLRHS